MQTTMLNTTTFEGVFMALSKKGYEMRLENQGDAEGNDHMVYRILSWDLVETAEITTLGEAARLALTLPDDFGEDGLTPEQENVLNTISEDAFHQYVRIQKDGMVNMINYKGVIGEGLALDLSELTALSRSEYLLILSNYSFLLGHYGDGDA